MDELKKIIRALLISTKNGLTVNELCSEYSAITSTSLPYKEFGFFSAVELLKDIPDVVRPIFLSGGVMLLKGIADESTAHIHDMVRRQKSVGRRNTKIVVNQVAKPVKLVVPDYVRNKLLKLIQNYPKGVNFQIFEDAYRRSYGRKIDYNAIGFTSVKAVLASCADIIKMKQLSNHSNQIFLFPAQASLSNPNRTFNFASLKSTQKKTIVDNITLPQSLKMEIHSLLSKYSKFGLSASKFIFEYENAYKKSFNLHSSGFHSIVELMSKIPDIVSIERPQSGGDWILRAVLSDEKLPPIITETAKPITLSVNLGSVTSAYISYIISPSSFWYQEERYVNDLEDLMEKVNKFFNSEKSYFFTSLDFKVGQFCCALYEEDKRWYRAIIKSVLSKELVKVHYIDYGNESIVKMSSLRFMLQEFYSLPQQAQHGKIANAVPKGEIWSEAAIKEFFTLTQDQQLNAKLVKVDRVNFLELSLCNDLTQDIGRMLSEKGFSVCHEIPNTTAVTVPLNIKEVKDEKQINNLKNYYQQYYQALKDVSETIVHPPTSTSPDVVMCVDINETNEEVTKQIKPIEITNNFKLHLLNYSNGIFVSSAEFSNLFWNADILRQMARQKGINLARVLLSSENSPSFFDLLVKENVKGLNDHGAGKSLWVYNMEDVLPLFKFFKSKFDNSKAILVKEMTSWNESKNDYWNNIKLSEAELNALQIQALRFKKKRLYMSMITNAAKPGTMDDLIAIEKQINLLALN